MVVSNGRFAMLEDPWTGIWWVLALRGAAALLLSIVAFTLPGPTLAAIVLVFGVYAIADGVFAIVAAVRGIRRHERWGAMLIQGIAGIVAGAIAILWPAIGALALTYLVAAWALVTGTLEIVAAVKLRKLMTGEWLLILSGVLSIILAVLLTLFPGVGMVVLTWWLGAYAFAYGVIGLALALRVRHWTRANAV
jgi:uncharacterized membrane protein HdeD (DUF308 family)